MKKLEDLIARLRAFEASLLETIRKVLEDNSEIIAEMNSEDQLYEKGVNRLGIEISSFAPYSPVTIALKREKNQPTNRVTLRDTEDFHFSFFVEFSAEDFELKASDDKTGKLISAYGETILGLTDENFHDLAQNYIRPELVKLFKELC